MHEIRRTAGRTLLSVLALCGLLAAAPQASAQIVSVSGASRNEGSSGGTTNLDFTVSLSAPAAGTVTVQFDTLNGSAVSPSDFTGVSTLVSFAPGDTSETVSVPVVEDTSDEGLQETFTVQLSAPSGATLGASSGTGTLVDDDAYLNVSDVSGLEGTASDTTFTFTISLGQAKSYPVTVTYATQNGVSANPARVVDNDYFAVAATAVTFAAGETTKTVDVTVRRDALDEFNEDLLLVLSAPSANASLDDGVGQATINDDDATVNVAPRSQQEGTVSGAAFPFTVSLTRAKTVAVSVTATAAVAGVGAGFAVTPGDFTGNAAVITFSPGETSHPYNVTVSPDGTDEPNETFHVNLSSPSANAVIGTGQATGTIVDDDATLSINDVSQAEGSGGGTTAFSFTISLLRAKPNPVTVSYATADGTASSSAPLDYAALALTPVTFAAGETTKTVTVNVVADDDDELPANQTFMVNLSNASLNASVSDAQGLGTISDDDLPELRVVDGLILEGNPPGTVTLQLQVTLSSPTTVLEGPVTVSWGTADDVRPGFTTATFASDYTVPAPAGRILTFPVGSTAPQTISITVVGDLLDEDAESMQVNLSGPSGNAVIKRAQGFGQIDDNDPAPNMTIGDVTVTEGNTGTVPATFTVALSTSSGRTVTVNYALGPGATATVGTDFETLAAGTLTFTPGQTSKTITVNVIGDTTSETSEEFYIRLTGVMNANLIDDDTPAQGKGTIVDNDPPPTLSIADISVTEGDAGTTDAVFTVTLSAVSGQEIKVNYQTVNSTALAGEDYTATPGLITFAANTTTLTQTITVPVVGEELDESNETFFVDLSGEVNAAVTQRRGEGLIIDDDDGPVISVADMSITEPDAGNSLSLVFAVTLSGPSSQTVTVDYAVAGDTATAGLDFNASPGTLTFIPGVVSRNVTVAVLGDDLPEANETFRVTLSNPANATLTADPTFALGTINDDDEAPQFTIDDVTVVEGNTGSLRADFTVSLDKPSGQALSVQYTTESPAGAFDAATAAPALVARPSALGSMTIPVGGPASPYGASIQVPNTLGLVTRVTARLNGLSHTWPEDLDVLLVSPSGQAVVLLSDVGGSVDVSGITLTFADTGTVPGAILIGGSTYKPTNVTPGLATVDAFPAPAPAGRGSLLSLFNGSDPGGTWRLYVVDDVSNADGGSISGSWTLNLETDDGNFTATARASIAVLDNATASPFPSSIVVPPTASTLIKARIDLHDLSHTFTTDLDILLVGPQGQRVLLMSDVGGTAGASGVTLTFDDAGDALTTNPLTTGLYRPTDIDPDGAAADTFTGIAGPYATTLSTFAGTNPSGPWNLYVVDDAASDTGSIAGGWTLHLQTVAGDYEFAAGRLRYLPGQTTKRVTVFVDADVLDEENERFSLKLSNAVASVIADGEGAGVIVDDDDEPTLAIDDVTQSEGGPPASGGTVTFTATLSRISGRPVTADFATVDITAQAGDDYEQQSGTLTFAPGVQTQTITVVATPDIRDEIDNETFAVDLTNPVHVLSVTKARGLATIADDDLPPAASVTDVTVTEGDTGTVDAVFTITLSNPSSRTVSLSYVTSDASAEAGADYTAVSGRLTFLPGELSKTVTVAVKGDVMDEDSGGVPETFQVLLGSPSLATIADGLGLGTITDDDDLPAISVADLSLNEGTGSPTSAVFVVSLSRPSSATVTVNYATADGASLPGSPVAVDGLDYTSPGIQALSFPPGTTTRTVSVAVNADGTDEPASEVFRLLLTNLSANATMGDDAAQATINDDDLSAVLTVSDVSATEGDSGASSAVFTVSLLGSTDFAVTVAYATSDGAAIAGADYAATSGTLTFPAGTTTQTVSVPVNGDTDFERAERFFLNLKNPTESTLQNTQAWATIINDDAPPSVSVADVTAAEGNAGLTQAVAAVSLSARSFEDVSVAYATSNVNALAGTDYVAASGVIVVPAGSLSVNIAVPVTGDLLPEDDETFLVTLSAPVHAGMADGQAVGTIVDDDAEPSLSVNDLSTSEGDAGTTNYTFTVSLSGVSGQTITVDYATADGSATAGTDYTATSGALTFAPGVLTQTVTVSVIGDDADEPDETLFVNLTGAVNATVADAQGVLALLNNDLPPTAVVADITLLEGNPGLPGQATFTVTLSRTSGFPISIRYLASDGTAASPGDYTPTTGILGIPPGDVTGTITVPLVGDAAAERAETLYLNLTVDSSSHVTLSDSQGQATLKDDDSRIDFNGDNKDDLIWQHADGRVANWQLDGPNRIVSLLVNPVMTDPTWKVVATADFDQDSKPDLLWRNASSGLLAVWYMDGVNRARAALLDPSTVADPAWKIAAAADMNGDGKPDILWRKDDGLSIVWYMDGVRRDGFGTLQSPPAHWTFAGTGDFNQDGKMDIVWQSTLDYTIVVWYMNGITKLSGSFITPSRVGPDGAWKVRGVGDYNGDTLPDLVLHNDATGQVATWSMSNLNLIGSVAFNPGQVFDLNWRVAAPR